MICTTVLLINLAGIPLIPTDIDAINSAQKVCQTQYKSCLSKITKQEPYVFRVICGNEKKSLKFEK